MILSVIHLTEFFPLVNIKKREYINSMREAQAI